MKLKFKKSNISETHFNKYGAKNITYHHSKHVAKDLGQYLFDDDKGELLPPMELIEYDMEAHKLSLQPVKTSDINSEDDVVGFVNTADRVVKYRKSLNDLVMYKVDTAHPFTVTYYATDCLANNDRYIRMLAKEYKREISDRDEYLVNKEAKDNPDNNLVEW